MLNTLVFKLRFQALYNGKSEIFSIHLSECLRLKINFNLFLKAHNQLNSILLMKKSGLSVSRGCEVYLFSKIVFDFFTAFACRHREGLVIIMFHKVLRVFCIHEVCWNPVPIKSVFLVCRCSPPLFKKIM